MDNSPNDGIVVVMGLTGAGKSTFIECATRQGGLTVGHKLRSFTADIRTVRATHPTENHGIVFVDTPGFDDTSKSDFEILSTIADFLLKTFQKRFNLAAIIYLHKISDNRVTGSVLKNLRLFTSLCGTNAMPNVVIATTMWGKVSKEEGEQREEELKRDFWNDMVAKGCRTERFENTYASAWRIIGSIMQNNPSTTLLIQQEMGASGKSLHRTEAGILARKTTPKATNGLRNLFRKLFLRSSTR